MFVWKLCNFQHLNINIEKVLNVFRITVNRILFWNVGNIWLKKLLIQINGSENNNISVRILDFIWKRENKIWPRWFTLPPLKMSSTSSRSSRRHRFVERQNFESQNVKRTQCRSFCSLPILAFYILSFWLFVSSTLWHSTFYLSTFFHPILY